MALSFSHKIIKLFYGNLENACTTTTSSAINVILSIYLPTLFVSMILLQEDFRVCYSCNNLLTLPSSLK